MNKYEQAVQATQERVKAGQKYDVMRKEKSKEGYLCYLAYMEYKDKAREGYLCYLAYMKIRNK